MTGNIDRFLLGDNPFIGVDHLSQERSRERRGGRLDSRTVSEIIDTALSHGAQGLVCSAHQNIKSVLEFMRETAHPKSFGIYLIVPDAQSHVRLASERGMIGLLTEVLGGLSLKKKAQVMIGGGFSTLIADPRRIMKTYLDTEIFGFSKTLPINAKIKSVFLHELITELMVSFKMAELAHEYIDFTKGNLNVKPGFVTRNFARFIDFADEADLPMKEIVCLTPFNRVGFQMNPSRELCEDRLHRAKDISIIAMSILAGGYLSIEDATAYIKNLRAEVSCVVGCSSKQHASETFTILKRELS